MAPRRDSESAQCNPNPRRRRQPEKDTEEYLKKRERNNVAVKKSRDKARMKQKETSMLVVKLRKENAELDSKVKLLSKELEVLRGLFIGLGKTEPVEEAQDQVQTNNYFLKQEVEEEEVLNEPMSVALMDHEYCS